MANLDRTNGYVRPILPENQYNSIIDECGIVKNITKEDTWNRLRIIGGRPAFPGSWPWQVAVLNRFKVIINKFNFSNNCNCTNFYLLCFYV